jgi:hypothetical protein
MDTVNEEVNKFKEKLPVSSSNDMKQLPDGLQELYVQHIADSMGSKTEFMTIEDFMQDFQKKNLNAHIKAIEDVEMYETVFKKSEAGQYKAMDTDIDKLEKKLTECGECNSKADLEQELIEKRKERIEYFKMHKEKIISQLRSDLFSTDEFQRMNEYKGYKQQLKKARTEKEISKLENKYSYNDVEKRIFEQQIERQNKYTELQREKQELLKKKIELEESNSYSWRDRGKIEITKNRLIAKQKEIHKLKVQVDIERDKGSIFYAALGDSGHMWEYVKKHSKEISTYRKLIMDIRHDISKVDGGDSPKKQELEKLLDEMCKKVELKFKIKDNFKRQFKGICSVFKKKNTAYSKRRKRRRNHIRTSRSKRRNHKNKKKTYAV